jgi:diguanylate cyclase (GGDEF)-like protein/PAS domain S-box-containing protein
MDSTDSAVTRAEVESVPRLQGYRRLAPWLTLCVGLVLSTLGAFAYLAESREHRAGHLQGWNAQIAQALELELSLAFRSVEHVRAFIAQAPDLDAQAFRDFLESSGVFDDTPGMRAIAYALRVTAQGLPALKAELDGDVRRRDLGYPALDIDPPGARDVYYPALLVEPHAGNERVFGFDLWADPARRASAQAAMISGRGFASAPVVLSQDADTGAAGLLYVTPVYAAARPPASAAERLRLHVGFVASGFSVHGLLARLMPAAQIHDRRLRVYDVGPALAPAETVGRALLFDSRSEVPGIAAEGPQPEAFDEPSEVLIEAGGRRWLLVAEDLRPRGLSIQAHAPLLAILGLGTALSVLASLLLATSLRQGLRVRAALRRSRSLFRSLFDQAPDGILICEGGGRLLDANPAAVQALGYEPLSLLDRNVTELIEPDDPRMRVDSSTEAGEMTLRYEGRLLRPDGRPLPIEAVTRHVALDEGAYRLTLFRDISRRRADEENLHRLAHYDNLTGLPNRAFFFDRLEHAIGRARRDERGLALLFLDLDNFKRVNDHLGHDVGDAVLLATAERLSETLRDSDSVARLGGDEFLVLITDLDGPSGAEHIAEKLVDVLAQPIALGERYLQLGVSIGIAVFPEHGANGKALLKNADTAMYKAKEAGRGRAVMFRGDFSESARHLLEMEQQIRGALGRGELSLVYQPVFSLPDRELLGAEALLRWESPVLGQVSPAEFIPAAEDTDSIREIGAWVLREACMQAAIWRDLAGRDLRVFVNLSPRQFEPGGLATEVEEALNAAGLPARCLGLELTERLLVAEGLHVEATLRRLRALGIDLAIDDFGTGYSAMAYLKRFPFSTLKIDRSFVRDVDHDAEDAALASAIVAMAHNLGLEVIGEGVEGEAQLAFLVEHGCNAAQGFHLARPQSAEQMREWCSARLAG